MKEEKGGLSVVSLNHGILETSRRLTAEAECKFCSFELSAFEDGINGKVCKDMPQALWHAKDGVLQVRGLPTLRDDFV